MLIVACVSLACNIFNLIALGECTIGGNNHEIESEANDKKTENENNY
jgi:hypothetical protein